jgi:hypothetical protein
MLNLHVFKLSVFWLITAILLESIPAHAIESYKYSIKWILESAVTKQDLAKVKKVLVSTSSELGLVSEFFDDALSVELMTSKISVVSREKRDQEQLRKLAELDKESNKDKPKEGLVDLLSIGKLMEVDALVVVTLIADTVQQNVFDQNGVRVTAVRPDLLIRACSVTVIEAGSGRLLLAGFVGYEDGTSLVNAAKEVGQGLVQQLR